MNIQETVEEFAADWSKFNQYSSDFIVGGAGGIYQLTPILDENIKIKPKTLTAITKYLSDVESATKKKNDNDAEAILARCAGKADVLRAEKFIIENVSDVAFKEAVEHLVHLNDTVSRAVAVAGINDLVSSLYSKLEIEVERRKQYLTRKNCPFFLTVNESGRQIEQNIVFEYFKIKEITWLLVRLIGEADEIESTLGFLNSQKQKAKNWIKYFVEGGACPI